MNQRRKLIEVALPLDAINVASAKEKTIRFGHPSSLHVWWARRPLAACRAVLFASLVDDPSSDPDRFPTLKAQDAERLRLFSILERLVLWENITDEDVLQEAKAEILRSTDGNPPAVLDPFCGGGSIPLEAQRLGLSAHASDLNPVAVLITKALIEIPPRFQNKPPVHPDARSGIGDTGTWIGTTGLAEDVSRYASWIRDEAKRRIGHLYPKVSVPGDRDAGSATVIAWIWARTVNCPNPACGARMPLVRSFELAKMKGNGAWVVPVIDRAAKTVRFEVQTGDGTPPAPPKVGRGANFRCLVCDQVSPDEHVKSEGRAKRMGTQLLAIVGEGQRGRTYLAPDEVHERAAVSAGNVPGAEEELANDPRSIWTINYGLTRFRDLFTPRQLIAMTTLADLVREVRARVRQDAVTAGLAEGQEDAYADAVTTYLALAVSRSANYNSSLSVWDSGPTSSRSASGSSARTATVRNAFARQTLAMTWDFAEANPFSGSGGSLDSGLAWIIPAISRLVATTPAVAIAGDASTVPSDPVMIATDPPYYDNIGYSDLSDFFYIWLRRMLVDIYPGLFATILTPKVGELVATPYRFDGDSGAAERYFEHGLGEAFRHAHEIAHPDFPLTFFYAFKQAEAVGGEAEQATSTGWETMLEGLLRAGFSIDGTWPIRTEQIGALKKDVNALASSVVLVCRPQRSDAGTTTRKGFVASLKSEMPEALRALQHGNIAPVDLAQSSIGPGMAIFSRYAKVLEPDGSAMRVRTALALINQVLDEILAEQEGEFDADTRWAIAWYEQFGLEEAAYGTAETLSRAKNTSVEGLVEAGIVAAARGRVRLLARNEYSVAWDPAKDRRVPVWEATQRLVHVLLTDGEAAAGHLLTSLGGLGDTARDLAYRMYHVAERKGWTEEARAYNALVVAWTDLARGAESTRATEPAQASLGLE